MEAEKTGEWKIDWPSAFLGALSGALIASAVTTMWIASEFVK